MKRKPQRGEVKTVEEGCASADQYAAGAAQEAASAAGSPRPVLNASKPVLKRSGPAFGGLGRDKLALIHLAKHRIGMADEVYRATLRKLAGVDSSTQLDRAGFNAMMEHFKALGFVSSKGLEQPPLDDDGRKPGMASAAQRRYVRGLWRQWHGEDNPKALRLWLQRVFGVTDLRFATEATARSAIEALKAMSQRKKHNAVTSAEQETIT